MSPDPPQPATTLWPITIAALVFVALLIVGRMLIVGRILNVGSSWRTNVVATVGDDSHVNGRLAVSGDLLVGTTLSGYVSSNVLWVYDITDPASPQRVGAADVGAEVQAEGLSTYPIDLAVEGTTASVIVATGQGPLDKWDDWSMKLIDLDDPAQPKTVGSLAFDTGTRVYAMDAQRGFVYVRTVREDVDGALIIIDARDPARPVQVANLPLAGQGDFDIEEDTLWIDTVHGLTAVDVSDPVHPHVLSTTPRPPDCRGRNPGASDVRVTGTWVLISSWDLCVLDGTDPAAPRLVHRFEPSDTATSLTDLVAVGGRAYATFLEAAEAGTPGVTVYDLAGPGGPHVYARAGGLRPWPIAAKGDYVYTSGWLDSDHSNHELIVLEVK
jgi:hypothetical protein